MNRRSLFILLALAATPLSASAAGIDPYADRVYNYSPGTLTPILQGDGSYSNFDDPSLALGAPDPNAAYRQQSVDVVQLGQGGSITLEFNEPIINKLAGGEPTNPTGVDFVVFGNAFEAGAAGSGQIFREPGFVEVAKRLRTGEPGVFYLILPEKLPSQMQGGVDTGLGSSLPAYYADVHPVIGTGNPLISPEQPGSAGGDAFYLERAVVESAPGIPQLDANGQVQYVVLDSVDFVRITDVLPSDGVAGLGGLTTDIDAVVALPAPEPSLAPLVIVALLGLRTRGSRRACL